MNAGLADSASEPSGGHSGSAAGMRVGREAAASLVAGRTSALIAAVAAGQGGSVSVAELSSGLSDRGLGFLLLLFAAPNALPVAIPGLSTVLAIPLLVIAMHLVLGWRSPVLPRFVGRRSISRDRFAAMAARIGPGLDRLERGLRPRWAWLTRSAAQRLVGVLVVVLALAIAVPFPFSNSLPGLGVCVIALGVLERDGLAIAAGCGIGLIALAVISGLALGGLQASELLFGMMPG